MGDFGSFLREKRKRARLTQEEMSKLLERKGQFVHASVLSRWETGGRIPGAKDRLAVLAIGEMFYMADDEKSEFLIMAGLSPLQPEELDVDTILAKLGPERWRKTYFLHKEMRWDEKRTGEKLGIPFWDVRADIAKAELLVADEQYPKHSPLVANEQYPKHSLLVSVLEGTGGTVADQETKRGGKLVAFRLGNHSQNVITVNRICLEVLSCEPCDLPPHIEARFMPLRYEVALRPDYLGEYVVTEDRFRYAGPNADDFEVVCTSAGGFEYRMRLNIYASDLATGKKFTVHSATFEILFYKKATGFGILGA